MDAKEYLREYGRHMKTYCANNACGKCERNNKNCDVFSEDMLNFIEKWSKEHPIKTNREKFKEVFGISFCDSPICGGKVDEGIKWLDQEYIEPEEIKETNE